MFLQFESLRFNKYIFMLSLLLVILFQVDNGTDLFKGNSQYFMNLFKPASGGSVRVFIVKTMHSEKCAEFLLESY